MSGLSVSVSASVLVQSPQPHIQIRSSSTTSLKPPLTTSYSYSKSFKVVSKRRRRSKYCCYAQSQSSSSSSIDDDNNKIVYQGSYGPWSIETSDLQEVILYRSGLVTAAVSFVVASSTAFLPDDLVLGNLIRGNLDILYAVGACGLGLSLYLIHIYVNQIKRTLQALWAIGCVGSVATYLALAQPAGEHLVDYVIHNPTAVWLVGPLFAALTGLVFKEGLCYGKLEAAFLTFIIPILLLGHLSGLMDDGLKVGLLGSWMALFMVFSARKFTQPIKDDIGDKSVFMFYALSDEEKAAVIQKLEQQNNNDSLT